MQTVDSTELDGISFAEGDFDFTNQDDIIKDEIPENAPLGFLKDAMMRFTKNKAAAIAVVIIGIIVILAIFGPMINPYSYREQHRTWDNLPPRIPVIENLGIFDGSTVINVQTANIEKNYKDALIKVVDTYTVRANNTDVEMSSIKINAYIQKGAEEEYFWFGTDSLGRDMWTRLWRGTRVSLLMSLMAVALNMIIGVLYGSISAYYGGKIDLVLQRFVEILGSIPDLPLLIIFIVAFGAGMMPIVLALCLTGWIGMSTVVRAQFFKHKDSEYVLASRNMGAKDRRIIFRHILPNAIGPTITQVTMAIPSFIMTESFLAYLGLGIQAPEPSVGVLLAEGQQVLLTNPHLILFPAIVISLLMLSFNLVNNGLRDSFDPTLRGQ